MENGTAQKHHYHYHRQTHLKKLYFNEIRDEEGFSLDRTYLCVPIDIDTNLSKVGT